MRALFAAITIVVVVILAITGVIRLFSLGIQEGYAPAQPIAFNHKLHAGDNKAPCLYCHYGARSSRHAGIPSSSVCMNCHNIMEEQTVEIEPFKEAAQIDTPPAQWTKVTNYPASVSFTHSRPDLSGAAELGKNPNDTCEHCHGD